MCVLESQLGNLEQGGEIKSQKVFKDNLVLLELLVPGTRADRAVVT